MDHYKRTLTPPPKLTPLALIVLTLLEEHPMHPYEVTHHFRVRHVGEYVKVKTGSLYHAFEQLQRRGLIETVEVEREGRRPERTVYQITELGVVTVEATLSELITEPVNEYTDFEAGLVMIPHLGREEMVRTLHERAQHLRARAAQHRTLLEENLADQVPHIYLLEVDHEVDRVMHQASWCDRIAAQVESGEIPWPDLLPREVEERAAYREVRQASPHHNGVPR